MIQASLQEALMELSVYKAKERADAAAVAETPVDLAPRIKEMEATHKEAQEEARKKAEENEAKIKVLTAKVRLPGSASNSMSTSCECTFRPLSGGGFDRESPKCREAQVRGRCCEQEAHRRVGGR